MRTTTLLTLLVSFFTSLALSAQQDRSVDIFAWPLSASKSSTLAKISYNSTAATVKSFNAPKIPPGDDVVRIGFYHPSGSWSGVATAAENLSEGKNKKLLLHLNTQGQLYHVGFKASEQGSSTKTGKGKDGLDVEVVKMNQGPTPHLNKPVVLNEQGQVDAKEPEKTFLQKYAHLSLAARRDSMLTS